MRKLIVALLVLVALLAAVDRVLVSAAEGVVARRVQVAAELEQEPTVKIRGFPFLTQAVAGEYGRVDISLDSLKRNAMRLQDLSVRLEQVHAPLGQMLSRSGSVTVRADSARARVTVPYEVVQQRMPTGADVQPQGDQLQVSGDVSLFGRQLPASALVEPSVAGGQLAFEASEVRAGGRTVTDQLAGAFSFTVDVGKLPFGLQLDGVEAAEGGLRVTARGTDILLTRDAGATGKKFAPYPRGEGRLGVLPENPRAGDSYG